MNAYTLTFMYLHNMFGEPRLFEKPVFGGYLTFQRYAEPLQDRQGLQPNRRGPNGEPWRWILSAITRHPLEKSNYQWDEWVKKMDGPLPGDEQSAVDKLMSLEGISLKGPLAGGINYFVSAVPVPVALALGWYEPSTPPVTQQELPPTAVFDGEGWVAMRSGWDAKATEVSFVSGVRDHTARHKPNHFTVIKAGNYLIGTPALFADDGNPVAVWGNSVVIDDKWPRDWAINLQHVRDGEHLVIHRFSPSSFTYVARDQQVVGYQPAESGFGGGLDLHGHCETMFMREGRLLGYQTWPELDYVAGDAANAWRADQVSRLDRQMVFMKPDLLLVYDRVKLGPGGHRSTWIAATGPHLALDGDRFAIQNGSEFLMGQALLPETPLLTAPKPMELGWIWKAQKLLEIAPMQQKDETEYLVVMRIGGGSAPLPPMDVIHDERSAGVKFSVSGRQIEVRLNRVGPVGGEATVLADGRTDHYQFRQAIVDSYANWRTDPRYDRWMTESRFRFMAPE